MTMFMNTCQVSRWNGRNSRYPIATKNAATMSAIRGVNSARDEREQQRADDHRDQVDADQDRDRAGASRPEPVAELAGSVPA